MQVLQEFRNFAMRGNVVDLAIGVIIGAAFNNVVQSLVGDIFMPVIGAITGGLDFSNYFVPLSRQVVAATLDEAKKQGAVLAWGHFVTVTINFIIVAWVMFWVVRVMNRMREAEAPSKAPAREEVLLAEIRDLLKAQAAGGTDTPR
jgi:large conductance mechanosensitive channel